MSAWCVATMEAQGRHRSRWMATALRRVAPHFPTQATEKRVFDVATQNDQAGGGISCACSRWVRPNRGRSSSVLDVDRDRMERRSASSPKGRVLSAYLVAGKSLVYPGGRTKLSQAGVWLLSVSGWFGR